MTSSDSWTTSRFPELLVRCISSSPLLPFTLCCIATVSHLHFTAHKKSVSKTSFQLCGIIAVESDPGVFTELICNLGTRGLEVTELWACDRESLVALQPVYGLIFLFKWVDEASSEIGKVNAPLVDENAEYSAGVYFAKQVITNACATQAIISILLNIPQDAPGFSLGPELQQLREFTADFPPEMRGLTIGNSEQIRVVHNSFHPAQSLVLDTSSGDKDGEAFHFIAYVPAAGGLYELDGLKAGPIRLCDCDLTRWIDSAVDAINARIASYSDSELRFNLMAVIRDRRDLLNEKLSDAQSQINLLGTLGKEEEGGGSHKLESLRATIADLQEEMEAEEQKRRKWAEENERRRTDFIPFTFHLLKALASGGRLKELVKEAKEKRESAANKRQRQ